jgi:uncharacterized SAM-binding protein YcdF (DUF218 family)
MSKLSAEALVVHGHGLTQEEELDLYTVQRMNTALDAWNDGVAPVLAVSGNHSFTLKHPPSQAEATVMKAYALKYGVPEDLIGVEDRSLDTIGNVLFTKTSLALPNNWEHLVVVTSRSHLHRTLGVYRHVFGHEFEISGIAAPEQIRMKGKIWETLGTAMMKEVLRGTKPGDHKAIQERLFSLVPGYGESTVPRLAFKSLVGLLRKS